MSRSPSRLKQLSPGNYSGLTGPVFGGNQRSNPQIGYGTAAAQKPSVRHRKSPTKSTKKPMSKTPTRQNLYLATDDHCDGHDRPRVSSRSQRSIRIDKNEARKRTMSQVDADNLFQQIYDRNLGDLMGKRAHDAETKRIVDSKKMKECTFKPKKISKVRYENGLT